MEIDNDSAPQMPTTQGERVPNVFVCLFTINDGKCLGSPGWSQTGNAAKSLELQGFPLLLSKCWDYRRVLPCLAHLNFNMAQDIYISKHHIAVSCMYMYGFACQLKTKPRLGAGLGVVVQALNYSTRKAGRAL